MLLLAVRMISKLFTDAMISHVFVDRFFLLGSVNRMSMLIRSIDLANNWQCSPMSLWNSVNVGLNWSDKWQWLSRYSFLSRSHWTRMFLNVHNKELGDVEHYSKTIERESSTITSILANVHQDMIVDYQSRRLFLIFVLFHLRVFGSFLSAHQHMSTTRSNVKWSLTSSYIVISRPAAIKKVHDESNGVATIQLDDSGDLIASIKRRRSGYNYRTSTSLVFQSTSWLCVQLSIDWQFLMYSRKDEYLFDV